MAKSMVGGTSFDPQVRKASHGKAFRADSGARLRPAALFAADYYVAAKDLVFTAYPDEIIRFSEMS